MTLAAASLLFTGSAFATDVVADDETPVAVDAPEAEGPVDAPVDLDEPADEAVTYENKGEFVRAKLDEGLRGKELTQAIHEWDAENTPAANKNPGAGRSPKKQLSEQHDKHEKSEKHDKQDKLKSTRSGR
jgi:hypothetical protein